MSKSRSRRLPAGRERLTLALLMTRDGVLDATRLVEVATGCCDVLAAHHARGQWRRDLSPSSLVVTFDESGVTGVDISEPASAGDEPFPASARYLAPERACGLPDDARSDLYALGCILFEVSTGKPPFSAPTLCDVVLAHVMVDPPRAHHLPPPVAAIVERLMSKEPTERYQTVAALRTALEDAAHALEMTADARSAA